MATSFEDTSTEYSIERELRPVFCELIAARIANERVDYVLAVRLPQSFY
jgi:hypothetical protein